ncbi:hypothetical protein, partial [Pleomorphomonas oryzae]|uniref:hypothetical protein n=1 Tax=Pleomorphomonas oryzae TaxID=261934 RepID=UPI001AEBDBB6
TENGVDALIDQRLDDHFRACHLPCHRLLPQALIPGKIGQQKRPREGPDFRAPCVIGSSQ